MNLVFAFLAVLASTSAKKLVTRFENVTWDDDHWKLESSHPDPGHYQGRANLANGYIGINVAALGPFFEADEPVNGDNIQGWPLFDRRQTFATVAGFYDLQDHTEGSNFEWLAQYGGESVISGIPHWGNLVVESHGYRNAVLSWQYEWMPPGGGTLDVHYSIFLHKLYVNQAAVQLCISSRSNVTIYVHDILNGDCAVRTDFRGADCDHERGMIHTAVSPSGYPNVTAHIYSTLTAQRASQNPTCDVASRDSNSSTISQTLSLDLRAGRPEVISKYVGIASSDAFDDPQTVAYDASSRGSAAGFSCLLRSHAATWRRIMPRHSVDDYRNPATGNLPNDTNILEAQILAVTNPFYLLQNTISDEAMTMSKSSRSLGVNSIQVCGLSSSCYAGMIFWDVEVWMDPGLVVAFPAACRQIAEYRLDKYKQARRNVQTAYTSSRNQTLFSPKSAIFPWTSGRFGNCTATGPCFDYEYHLNGDIALQLKNYLTVTGDGDTFRARYQPIYESITQVYSDLLIFNETLDAYTLLNATDPDEYANFVDNPSYTMVLIKSQLESTNVLREYFGQPRNSSWTAQANDVFIPVNRARNGVLAAGSYADIILEYSGMNGSIDVKQADVVLIDDLLDYRNNYTLTDLDYYAERQSVDGPGMTYSVFSVVASGAAPAGCSAYTYDLWSSQPYLRQPWFQYSEQLNDDYSTNGGTHPAFPFLTGMGGTIRINIFGYLGLRLQIDVLNIDPSLPPQIEHLKYRTIYWQGHAVTAFSNQTHTVVGRRPKALENANTTFSNGPIPVTVASDPKVHFLYQNSTLTFTNRLVAQNKTVPGNIAQCKPALSLQKYVPGQFPLAAVDGAVSTLWQPRYSNESSTLRVTLGSAGIQPIGGFMIDWAREPARSFSVAFSNSSNVALLPVDSPESSSTELRVVYEDRSVTIKEPYDATMSTAVLKYIGNTTSIKLPDAVYGGQYAFLTIYGNQATPFDNGTGATVAEWAIVPQGYSALARRYFNEK